MQLRNNQQFELESSESDMSDGEPMPRSPEWGHSGRPQYSDDDEEESSSHRSEQLEEDSLEERRQRESQSQEEQSSEEEDEDYNQYPLANNGIHTVRQDSRQSSDEQESIDHIEQRIKKLERDLEGRLNKHVPKPPSAAKPNSGKILPLSQISSPPIPSKVQASRKNPSIPSGDGQNKMSVSNEVKKVDAPSFAEPTINKQRKKPIIKKQVAKAPEPKVLKQQKHEVKSIVKQQQKKIKNNQKKPVIIAQESVIKQDEEQRQKMQEMERMIEDLRSQNKKLREDLKTEKAEHKNKKKPLQQLQKLKELSSTNTKLQKQLQLLEVIEKLQAKLKKSINRKLAKTNKANGSATLLHKGLPASMLANI